MWLEIMPTCLVVQSIYIGSHFGLNHDVHGFVSGMLETNSPRET